jgi:ribosomal-protein-alanine N-acetyltransferase
MSMPELLIRRGDIDSDLDGILALDALTFTNPWTREMYEWEARRSDVSRLYVVYERGVLIAYCAVWVIHDELHINNLAVHPDRRRAGVARELLEVILREAGAEGAHEATLEVRRSNVPALKLYERLGFAVEGVRRGYYTHPEEDALVLWRRRRTEQTEAVHGSVSGPDPTA